MTPRPGPNDPTLPGVAPVSTDPDASGDYLAPGTLRLLGGRYEITGLIGMGGMGAVYRAKDLELGEVVALKVLKPDVANGAEAHARFRREVRLARRVTHRNVARTYDLGDADGHRFLTMELVDGASLGEVLEKKGPLAIERALHIALAICEGVAAAHEAGVIHRDLKPDNVVIAADGRVVVMDFGVARGLEERGELARFVTGTPAYMAPEQAENVSDLDGRADQYAIGAIFYEMLTGRMPFPGNTLASLAQRLLSAPPNPLSFRPDIGADLARVIQKCMARNRDDRFATVADVADALRALRDPDMPVTQRAPSTLPPKMTRDPVLLAVLPLDAGEAPDVEHIGFGITDGLIDALGSAPGLRVCSRGVTSRIKGSHIEVRERARLLGAQVLLTGSIVLRNQTVVVKLHLATVEDGFMVWRGRFQGGVADVARITEEAAAGAAQALGIEAPRVERSLSNPEALDLYLRGRREYFRFSPAANARATELLRQATSLSPNDPVVLSAYAMAAARQLGVEVQYAGPLEIAQNAARRAHQIAPDRVESLVALGTVALHAGEAPTAAAHAARALQIAPGSPEAQQLAARLLLESGAVAEGTATMDVVLELEPRYGGMKYAAARAAALAGDWTESKRLVLGPVDRVSPFSYWLDRLRMCIWRGDPSWIVGIDMDRLPGLEPAEQKTARQTARLIRERRMMPELVETFTELTYSLGATTRTKAFFAILTAETRAYVGLIDEGVSALLRAVSEGLADAPWLTRCPVLEPLRRHDEVIAAIPVVADRALAVRAALSQVTTR
jgi:serine/threonine-protein kinase